MLSLTREPATRPFGARVTYLSIYMQRLAFSRNLLLLQVWLDLFLCHLILMHSFWRFNDFNTIQRIVIYLYATTDCEEQRQTLQYCCIDFASNTSVENYWSNNVCLNSVIVDRIVPSICGLIAINFLWPLFTTGEFTVRHWSQFISVIATHKWPQIAFKRLSNLFYITRSESAIDICLRQSQEYCWRWEKCWINSNLICFCGQLWVQSITIDVLICLKARF